MENNVSIENYKPDFAVEAAYDLTVADLKKEGIKAVLVEGHQGGPCGFG